MVVICTHDGKFHTDEVVAIAMLKCLRRYADANVVRTRNEGVIAKADIVVDVGGVYDHAIFRYDHHQRGFEEYYNDRRNTLLSSAGLIFRHYGKDVLQECYNLKGRDLDATYNALYIRFIESVDGVDNGVSPAGPNNRTYYLTNTDLSARVRYLNPAWNDKMTNVNDAFNAAVEYATEELHRQIKRYVNVVLPAAVVVRGLLEARFSVHKSGRIIESTKTDHAGCPFLDHIYDWEDEQRIPENQNILFVLFRQGGGAQCRLRAVTVRDRSFENRLSLPENLRGLRGAALCTTAGIQGLNFVHATGFIGGGERDALMKLAVRCVNQIPTAADGS
eukprot:Lankesteria_metandrocarpae@DN231_c0_g1_i1.p1